MAIRAALILVAVEALAGTTGKWVDSSAKDFGAGEFQNVAVRSSGRVFLAPLKTQLFKGEAAWVWRVAQGKDVLWVATGDKGVIYKVTSKGTVVAFTPTEKADREPFALTVDREGNAIVAYSTSGNVYRVPTRGEAKLLFKAGQRYVWDMLVASDGCFILATGDEGKVLKVSHDGKIQEILDADDAHVLSLAEGKDGTIYAGSGENGLLYAIGRDGPRVLYDAAESEIRALAWDGLGNLYFSTAGGETRRRGMPSMRAVGPRPEAAPAPPSATPQQQQAGAAPAATPQLDMMPMLPLFPMPQIQGANSLYVLKPSGDVRRVATRERTAFLSLAFWEGHIYVGTGNEGFVFRLEEDDSLSAVGKLAENQVTVLAATADGLAIGTANPGRVYLLSGDGPSEGSLVSRTYDCQFVAHWGRLYWAGEFPLGTEAEFSVRTGNTETPGAGWSDWKKCGYGARIECPPGRFIQYRATLRSSKPPVTPYLSEVTVFYATANQPPIVKDLSFSKDKAGDKPSQPGRRAAGPERGFSGKLRISWSAEDPNGDQLSYSLWLRGEGEKREVELVRSSRDTSYTLDTESIPDGRYVLRLVASDEGSNPAIEALKGERVSDPVLIDNTPPKVTDIKFTRRTRGGQFSCTIQDELSTLTGAEYSLDSKGWKPLQPADGIFDSREESAVFAIEELEPGQHILAIRAVDDCDNTGAGKLVFGIE